MVDWDFALEMLSGFSWFTVPIALYFGLIIGSFLNVVIYRLPMQRSIVFPGSACGGCGVPLKWWNNVPLLSYLSQRGKCAQCGCPFSPRYMLVEALCGAASLGLLYLLDGFGWAWLYQFTLFCVATAVFFTDLDHWIIPDEVNAFGVLFGLALAGQMPYRGDMEIFADILGPWVPTANWASSLLGILIGYAFFWFIQLLGLIVARQDAMGDGDLKYAAVLGAFLGWQMALLAFLLSFFLGALFAVPLLLGGKDRGKDPIPFGTFMSLAAVPVSLWGSQLWARLEYMEWF